MIRRIQGTPEAPAVIYRTDDLLPAQLPVCTRPAIASFIRIVAKGSVCPSRKPWRARRAGRGDGVWSRARISAGRIRPT